MAERTNLSSGGPYEDAVGYSRVVVVGDRAWVAGTTAIDDRGLTHAPGDAGAQARFVFDRILAQLCRAGFDAEHIVRTRMYLTDIDDQQAVGEAHLSAVGRAKPAATMVAVAALCRPDIVVEIEAEAAR